jgi:hypothetical protein
MFETEEALIEHMLKGDTRCEFALESRVEKAQGEEGDHHPIGKQGTVKGSVFAEISGREMEAYLVLFEGDEVLSFIVKAKLKSI